QWLGSRESCTFAATRLAVRVLDTGAVLLRPSLGGVNPLRRLGARAGVRTIDRRHAATRFVALQDRPFLAVRHIRRRARRGGRVIRIWSSDARALLVAEHR